MPAVMVPAQSPPLASTARMPGFPQNNSAPPSPPNAAVSWGQPPAQQSMSNEYPAPSYGPTAQAQSGPIDMQRLFAPPMPNDQRTITAQALKKRIPVWAVAVGSASVGLLAFGLVVLMLSHSSSPEAETKGAASGAAASATSAPIVALAGKGPFVSARAQFAATLASVPAPTHDAVAPAPPPTPTVSVAAPPPAVADDTPPIPTTNVAALPTATPAPPSPPVATPAAVAARASAPRPAAPAAAPVPAAAGAGSGTLKVICFPGCDQVIDNGSPLGPSPIVRRNANLGSHRIKLVWSDASTVVSTIVIADTTATVRQNHP